MSQLQARGVLGNQNVAGKCPISALRANNAISRIPSQHTWRIILCGAIGLFGLVLVTGCGRNTQAAQPASGSGEWHEFQGTWTAAGSRNVMRLEGNRSASIANFNGSLVLSGASRPNVGFRAEVIVFNDSSTGIVGRAVWTDERGDKAFSELQGSGSRTDNKIIGTFVGGTGRYAGATGTYEFSWRFVLESEDGNLQGESLGLKGRVRVESSQASSSFGGPRS